MGNADIARTQGSYIAKDAEQSVTELPSQLSCKLRLPRHILVMLIAIHVGSLREAFIVAIIAEKSVGELPSQLSYRLRHPKHILVMLGQ